MAAKDIIQKQTRQGDSKADAQCATEAGEELIVSNRDPFVNTPDREVTPIWMIKTPERLKLVDLRYHLTAQQESKNELGSS